LLQSAFAARALPGQTVHGDLHLIQPFDGGCLIAVVDGLGHGEEAARAARQAAATMAASASRSIPEIVQECHHALRHTRGVVMSLASLNAAEETMTWAGVGNVEGVLLKKDATTNSGRELLLSRQGVVGYRLPRLVTSVIAVAAGDTLVFATDGVREGFWQDCHCEELPQRMAERIVSSFGKGTDDALVVAARYLGCAP
jgi:serine phosphatase RsbU (regulator of sigma subunit)